MRSGDDQFKGKDITSLIMASNQRKVAECLTQTIRVGFVDSESIGCVASDIVLYVSLVVIIGVVAIRFFMAVLFGWFLSWKIGKYPHETYEQRRARAAEIEDWTDDIYRPAPARYRPNAKLQKKSMLPKTSRFTKGELLSPGGHSGSTSPTYRSKSRAPSLSGSKSLLGMGMRNSPPDSPGGPSASRSSTSLPNSSYLVSSAFQCDPPTMLIDPCYSSMVWLVVTTTLAALARSLSATLSLNRPPTTSLSITRSPIRFCW